MKKEADGLSAMLQNMNCDLVWGRNAVALLPPVRNMAVSGNVNRMSEKSQTDGNLNFLLRMSAVVTRDCHFVLSIPTYKEMIKKKESGRKETKK
jgi:hypothetical protein